MLPIIVYSIRNWYTPCKKYWKNPYGSVGNKWISLLDICMWYLYTFEVPKILLLDSGVARAVLGGRLAHPESQNEEENEQSLRKNKKIDRDLRDCEAGYGPAHWVYGFQIEFINGQKRTP